MNDNILVEQTLAGDHQAFNGLITDYYADIYGMILSWVKEPEDAKDLTQDVFISAYLDLPSLNDRNRFYWWLRQIAKHKCQNWRRKKIDFVSLHDDLISKEPSTDEVLILRETLAKVMEAIDNLPEAEKILLKEHYLDDVSYDELEARRGVSAKALVMRLVRIRQKIRDQLEKTLSAYVAFFHDHTESILTGGTEIVKVSIKRKLIVTAIVLICGMSFFLWHHGLQHGSPSNDQVSVNNALANSGTPDENNLDTNSNKIGNAISFPGNSNSASDSDSENDAKVLPAYATDAAMVSGVESESKEDKNKESKPTIEQQHNLDIATRTVPRWFELHDWFIELDREENRKPPEGISGDELGMWLQQRDQKVELKYPSSLKRERYAEQKRIETELMEKFPAAIYYKKEGSMEGVFFDFVKLRELCGGKLPIVIGN